MLPSIRKDREHMVSTMALPRLYGMDFTNVDRGTLQKRRRNIWATIKGGLQPQPPTAQEAVFSLVCRRHLCDPVMYKEYRLLIYCGLKSGMLALLE